MRKKKLFLFNRKHRVWYKNENLIPWKKDSPSKEIIRVKTHNQPSKQSFQTLERKKKHDSGSNKTIRSQTHHQPTTHYSYALSDMPVWVQCLPGGWQNRMEAATLNSEQLQGKPDSGKGARVLVAGRFCTVLQLLPPQSTLLHSQTARTPSSLPVHIPCTDRASPCLALLFPSAKVSSWGLGKGKPPFMSIFSGVKKHTLPAGRVKRLSDFSNQLRERKKLAFIYGQLEKNRFKKIIQQNVFFRNTGGNKLLICLEKRLDRVLVGCWLLKTIFSARQAITHKKIMVNRKITTRPHLRCRAGDVITLTKQLGGDFPLRLWERTYALDIKKTGQSKEVYKSIRPLSPAGKPTVDRPTARVGAQSQASQARYRYLLPPQRPRVHVFSQATVARVLRCTERHAHACCWGGGTENTRARTCPCTKNIKTFPTLPGSFSITTQPPGGRGHVTRFPSAEKKEGRGATCKCTDRAPLKHAQWMFGVLQVESLWKTRKTLLHFISRKHDSTSYSRGEAGHRRRPQLYKAEFIWAELELNKIKTTTPPSPPCLGLKNAHTEKVVFTTQQPLLWYGLQKGVRRKPSGIRERVRHIPCKPQYIEISHRLYTIIVLFSPQSGVYPTTLDVDLIMRSLR